MTPTASVLQLHHRDAFERNVSRSLVAGAGVGALSFASHKLGLEVPLSYLAVVGVSLACVRGDRMDRLMLAGLSVVLPGLPWLFGLAHGWTVALAAAAAGALMVKSRICEKGDEGSVAAARPGLWHYAVGAVGTSALTVAGFEVAKVLATRLIDAAAPALLVSVLSGTVLALFAAVGGIAAHLMLKPDPVEARCEELIPRLQGEFRTLGERALTLYRQCGQSLALLPREPAREDMARTLSRVTQNALELASDWAGVESQLEETAGQELAKEVAELGRSAAAAKDPVARRQLELAAASLREELARLDELKLRRERLVAKLKAEVALLERARVSLIGMRSGHTQLKGAELSALARKLSALATAQADEARLADAAATHAELAHQEIEAASQARQTEPPLPTPGADAPAPVAPVTAEGTPTSAEATRNAEPTK